MFTQDFISKLGRKNICLDADLVMSRVNAAWDGAGRDKQHEVLALADIPNNTIYRVRRTGIITAKAAVALGQVLNVNPYYLIGAPVENDGYSLEAARKFLIERGDAKAVREYDKQHGVPKKAAPAAPAAEAAPVVQEAPKPAAPTITAVQNLSSDEMVLLLRGVILKAGMGQRQAIENIKLITELLLG